MPKTTIQLDKSTKDEIDNLVDGKNYTVKLQKLIDGYRDTDESLDESDVRAIVDKRIDDLKRQLR
jgi:hypothetical protein